MNKLEVQADSTWMCRPKFKNQVRAAGCRGDPQAIGALSLNSMRFRRLRSTVHWKLLLPSIRIYTVVICFADDESQHRLGFGHDSVYALAESQDGLLDMFGRVASTMFLRAQCLMS